MTSMPEVGSKISLVSKADIRYEGRLFTVDPQECTIALANVRSFGTEDRETPYPIPPQPTVYDYILFRGSDIKDIRVINSVAIPNDPAIMQMHLPPQQNFSPMQHSNNSQSFGPFGGHMPGNSFPTSIGQNLIPPQQQQQQQQSSQQQNQSPVRQQQDSRSGTPQNVSRKSPSSEAGAPAKRDNHAANKDKGPRNNQNQNKNNQQQREKRDSPRHVDQENKGGYKNQRPHQQQQNNHQMQQHNQQQRGGYRNSNNGGAGNNNANNHHMNNNKNNNNHQHQGRMIQGGTNRVRNNYNNNKPQQLNNKPNNGAPRVANKPQYDDFDFDEGNTKFEEIRLQFSNLKVGTEEVKAEQVANGDVDKKEDSGNETGADHETECDDNSAYDKTKSFFDNISCEAVERSKGKMPRTDWRQERKINTETFGFSSNRRGNYRGRPQNNRGGPRTNGYYYHNRYNNQNNYRPRNNNRNQTNAGQSTGVPPQPSQPKPVGTAAAS